MTSNRETLAAVHASMDGRLFGDSNWLADRDECEAIGKLLRKLGYIEQISEDTFRNTPLGEEANIGLLGCFLGTWDEWEIPEILRSQGYIDLEEWHELYEQLEHKEPEVVLRPAVKEAWRRYCNPSGLVS